MCDIDMVIDEMGEALDRLTIELDAANAKIDLLAQAAQVFVTDYPHSGLAERVCALFNTGKEGVR